MHFDPEVAYKYSAVRDEADRLWKESIDNHDDSIATAAAGAVLFIVNAADGGECLEHDTTQSVRTKLTYIAVCTMRSWKTMRLKCRRSTISPVETKVSTNDIC